MKKQVAKLLTDRKAREDLREKFEVAMAAVVLTGFVIKKVKSHRDSAVDITSFGKEK